MFCRYCGTELRDGASFCARCGKRVDVVVPSRGPIGDASAVEGAPPVLTNAVVAPGGNAAGASSVNVASLGTVSASSADHPYKHLGGFLGFIVYLSYITAGLSILSALLMFVSIGDYSKVATQGAYMNAYVQTAVATRFVAVIANIAAAVYCICFANLIRHRNPAFLKVYHYFAIVNIVIVVIAFFAVGGIMGSTSANAAYLASATSLILVMMIVAIVSLALGVFLMTLYYVKSVRVRTYFGSDEYLKQSPFTRNVKAPDPAVAD